MPVPNPHDHFFRANFGRTEVAADFARHYLPDSIAEHLDLSTLRGVPSAFVDDELRTHFTDLLYQTALRDGSPAYLYLLFEHKSYPEPWVAFQLLRYMVRIWEYVRRQTELPSDLPPIFPLVVYHGARQWGGGYALSKPGGGPDRVSGVYARFSIHRL